MTRVFVRHLASPSLSEGHVPVDHLEVREDGAWMRFRSETKARMGLGRTERCRGRLEPARAAALFAELESILSKADRRAPAGRTESRDLFMLAGFRPDPVTFLAGLPGFKQLEAEVKKIAWELPPAKPAVPWVARKTWSCVGEGTGTRVAIDAAGAVEEEREGWPAPTHVERFRLPKEVVDTLFSEIRGLMPITPAAPSPREMLEESVELDLGQGLLKIDGAAPALLKAVKAALPPEPAWAPLVHRLKWRMIVPETTWRAGDDYGPSHEMVDGLLKAGGRLTREIYAPNNRDPIPEYPEEMLDPARADALFGLAAALAAAAPPDGAYPGEHLQAPHAIHTFSVLPLVPERGERYGVECAHTAPAYAALERALRETLGGFATVAEAVAAGAGRVRASVAGLDGPLARLVDRTGELKALLRRPDAALAERLSAHGLVDAKVRAEGAAWVVEEIATVRRGLLCRRDEKRGLGRRTRSALLDFLKREPSWPGLVDLWGREDGDVGSPDTWIWDLKTGEEAWVTAPQKGRVVRVALLPRRGDPEILFQA